MREHFLDFEINLIDILLGVEFNGTTLVEKEAFCSEYSEARLRATQQLLADIITMNNTVVVRFGGGDYETDWVVAESKQQAFDFYQVVGMYSDADMVGMEVKELDKEVDFILLNVEEVPKKTRHMYKKSKLHEDYLEVPLIHIIDYALQRGARLPTIVHSLM